MPRHPILIFAWELWAKHRRANAAVLAAIPLCALLVLAAVKGGGLSLREDWIPVALLPMLASILWVFSLFSCTESDARRGFTGLPARLFALPIRSNLLVLSFCGLGALTVAALYLAWARLVFAPAGLILPLWFPAAALATGLVFFQAVVWGLASFPWLRVAALVSGAVGFLALNVVGLSDDTSWAHSEQGRAMVVLAFLPVAYGLALFGVQAERSGGWYAWVTLRRGLAWLAALLPRRTTPFHSMEGAQFWFEWRRKGWFGSVAISCCVAGVVTLLPMFGLGENGPGLPVMGSLTACLFPLLTAGTLGLGLAKSDYWSKELVLQPFHAVRPMSCAGLVFSKFQVSLVITALGWVGTLPLVWLVTLSPYWRDMWRVSELTPRFLHSFPFDHSMLIGGGIAGLVFLAALSWKTMVESLSLGLTGRSSVLLSRSVIRGVFVVCYLSLAGWLFHHPGQSRAAAPFLDATAGLLVVWKCLDTVAAFRRVATARLASGCAIGILVGSWLAFAGGLGTMALVVWLQTAAFHPVFALLIAGLWPDGAFARALLNLQANRHR